MPFAIYQDEYTAQDENGRTFTLGATWFVRVGLGIFWECSTKPEEARRFDRRADAVKVLHGAGKHRQGWRVVRVEE